MNRQRQYWRFSFFVLLAPMLLGLWCAPAIAQSQDAVRFEVPVLVESARYLDLLAAPGIAVLALENNELYPSLSSRLVIKDREAFTISSGVVRYVGRHADVYSYEAGFNLSLGVGESTLTFPVEVDTSAVSKGMLTIRMYPPLAKFLPEDLLQRVEFKIRSLADLQSQRKLLTYLDRVSSEQKARGRGFDGILEAIALEAYNRSGGTGQSLMERGRAESLSDQVVLLAVLAVWLIGFPIFLFLVRRKQKKPA